MWLAFTGFVVLVDERKLCIPSRTTVLQRRARGPGQRRAYMSMSCIRMAQRTLNSGERPMLLESTHI